MSNPDNPLGPLTDLAARADEWRARNEGLGSTWAGVWRPALHDELLALVAQHTVPAQLQQ